MSSTEGLTLRIKVLGLVKNMPPEGTIRDLVASIETSLTHSTCRCGRPIVTGLFSEDDEWVHWPHGDRGCRAASFDPDTKASSAWDDSINPRQHARPQ